MAKKNIVFSADSAMTKKRKSIGIISEKVATEIEATETEKVATETEATETANEATETAKSIVFIAPSEKSKTVEILETETENEVTETEATAEDRDEDNLKY